METGRPQVRHGGLLGVIFASPGHRSHGVGSCRYPTQSESHSEFAISIGADLPIGFFLIRHTEHIGAQPVLQSGCGTVTLFILVKSVVLQTMILISCLGFWLSVIESPNRLTDIDRSPLQR
jgi:hypothetical protein